MSLIFEMIAEEEAKTNYEKDQLLINLYKYLRPKMDMIGFCQECSCDQDSLEIVNLFNYVEKYYPEEIKQ